MPYCSSSLLHNVHQRKEHVKTLQPRIRSNQKHSQHSQQIHKKKTPKKKPKKKNTTTTTTTTNTSLPFGPL
ncbi:hypothetical protein K439DRAFT_811788 [Ramaria rubella]|nr:hypothetical protein K439DRAFT_811788 [Ramaria rubella]